MILGAYGQATGPKKIRLWVGMFGTEQPPPPRFFINGVESAPADFSAFRPIRDRAVGSGNNPNNHQGTFEFDVAKAGQPYLVRIEAGGESYEFRTNTLPDSVPARLEGTFNVLLCSCYSQPDDHRGLLGTIVSAIKVQPDLTVMAGDQVYLDLPLLEDLPESEPRLSRVLGEKYMRNWISGALRVPGLEAALTRAPVVCIPDDHEYWNNFPFKQKQLPNTWSDTVRQRWADAAQALFEDYQIGGDHRPRTPRIDVPPLRMLFVDMRSRRDDRFDQLMAPETQDAMRRWVDDLIAERRKDRPVVGLLASGQALFVDPPQDDSRKRNVDAEMGNYAEFDFIQQQIARLADNGIPLIYVTGDVHWSRVASGRDLHTGSTLLYEVIASPSRLISVPLLDTAKGVINDIRGIFGPRDPWPRHSPSQPVPDRFGANRRFALRAEFPSSSEPPWRGDNVAILSFSAAGAGVDMQVCYYTISADKSISRSRMAGPFQLRPM